MSGTGGGISRCCDQAPTPTGTCTVLYGPHEDPVTWQGTGVDRRLWLATGITNTFSQQWNGTDQYGFPHQDRPPDVVDTIPSAEELRCGPNACQDGSYDSVVLDFWVLLPLYASQVRFGLLPHPDGGSNRITAMWLSPDHTTEAMTNRGGVNGSGNATFDVDNPPNGDCTVGRLRRGRIYLSDNDSISWEGVQLQWNLFDGLGWRPVPATALFAPSQGLVEFYTEAVVQRLERVEGPDGGQILIDPATGEQVTPLPCDQAVNEPCQPCRGPGIDTTPPTITPAGTPADPYAIEVTPNAGDGPHEFSPDGGGTWLPAPGSYSPTEATEQIMVVTRSADGCVSSPAIHTVRPVCEDTFGLVAWESVTFDGSATVDRRGPFTVEFPAPVAEDTRVEINGAPAYLQWVTGSTYLVVPLGNAEPAPPGAGTPGELDSATEVTVQVWPVTETGCHDPASPYSSPTVLTHPVSALQHQTVIDPAATGEAVPIVMQPDGHEPMAAIGDFDTDGGGWTLVLQYAHAGGTTPAFALRLPSIWSTQVPVEGDNNSITGEQGTDGWGHANPPLLAGISDATELRWWGRTSRHGRTLHFRSPVGLDYARTGVGDMCGIENDWAPLPGHDANLPATANNCQGNNGNQALTRFPFFQSQTAHWGIRAGAANRYEVDDVGGGAGQATVHKVWIR